MDFYVFWQVSIYNPPLHEKNIIAAAPSYKNTVTLTNKHRGLQAHRQAIITNWQLLRWKRMLEAARTLRLCLTHTHTYTHIDRVPNRVTDAGLRLILA